MNKSTSDSSFEPSAKEISSSIYYIRVNESYNKFQNSQDADTSISNFHVLLNDLNLFISSETDQNFIKYYIKSIITNIIQFSSTSSFNLDNLTILFEILDKIFVITMNLDYFNFPNFLFSLMKTDESIKFLKNHQKTLETIFSNEIFFNCFVEQQNIENFFDLSFIQLKSVDLCYLFRHLICEISPFESRSKINLSKILSFLSTTIEKEIQVEYSIVLYKLISINQDDRLFLNKNQNFSLFSNCIQSASSEIIIECFNKLVFTAPTNCDLFINIILFYQKYPEHQKLLFQWIFNNIVINHSDMLHEINDIVPFYGWVTKMTPVNDVINAIFTLEKYEVNFISPFLSPLFSLLNNNKPNFEEFKNSVKIIESQILLHKTSLLDLANFNFLKTFVIDININLLGQLFERIYTFPQLVYDIYILPKSKSLRPYIINKLIQMCGKFPRTSQSFSIFFVISNSKKSVSYLMKTIIDNKNGELCVALCLSLAKSDTIVKYFLSEKGIEWIDKIFKAKLIDLKQFTFLINSLTKNQYINEVDKYIQSLPKSHPIFSIVQDDLMTLSYGFENSHHHYPLKITSLFPLLKCPQTIDPYNAYMIGKHVFDRIQNINELPILPNVVNRYMNDESFQKIIEMNPSKYEMFCDSKYDHFPLFQVDEYFDNNVFNVKFKAISFWFKFSNTLKKEQKIPFFITEKLQLFVKSSSIFVNYNGDEYDVSTNPCKWNHIIVSVSLQKNSNYIYVYVNNYKDFFIPSSLLLGMTSFEFSTESSFLFIGPSIRIYQNENIVNDIETINKNGPSFLGHLNESLIITPSLLKNYFQSNKNTFAVEYRGFPSLFLSQRKKNLFANRITNSNVKKNEFIFAIKTCFKAYLILNNSFNNFIPFLLTIYSKVPRFVNENVLLETFDFFLENMSKVEVINTIVAQEQFWSNIPIDMIIITLFKSFYNFDFYKDKKQLECFFAIKSFFSKGNINLFKYLFQFHNCQSILLNLFAASHFISKKQVKFTQCNLQTTISQNKETNEKISQNKELNENVSQSKETNENVSQSKETNENVSQSKETNENVSQSKETNENVSQNKELNENVSQNKETNENVSQNKDLDDVIVNKQNVSIQCNLLKNSVGNSLIDLDSICLFQTINITEFQKNFAVFLNKIIIQSKNVSLIPISSIYGLFITSNTKTRIYLYPILLNCEKISPNSIQFDSVFLSLIPPMFVDKRVWIETFHFLTSDTTEIKKPLILPVLFSLLWGYTVASIQSIASNGNQIKLEKEIIDIIDFLSTKNNLKILSINEGIQKFIVSWFPYLLGVNFSKCEFHSTEEGFTSQKIILNDNKTVTSPSTFCFLSMIWRNVIKVAGLLIQTKSEYFINLQSFIVNSHVFKFYFNLTFSMPDSIFDSIIGAFFLIPFVSGKSEMTNCFMSYFTHSLLNVVTDNLSPALKVSLILPYIHFVCLFGQINEQYYPIIFSDLLLISSVINIVNNESFRDIASSFDLLFMNLFLSIIKYIDNNSSDKTNFINIINSLYQSLHQQSNHFLKILTESQITVDFYIQFFKKTSQFCSDRKLFVKFITEFGNTLNINQNKQFQSLLNDNELNLNEFDIAKWNDFIISKINQNKKNYLSFNYFKQLSKSFTIMFLNELGNQHNISNSLQHIIEETKKFENKKK